MRLTPGTIAYLSAIAFASGAGIDRQGSVTGFRTSRIHARVVARRKMARASRRANR